jgi:prepilin-type N-terminal cleavage/methylation domain-containing protein
MNDIGLKNMKKLKTKIESRTLFSVGGHQSTSGFTLLELLVVIIMGSVLMTVAVTGLRGVVRHHAAEELISELHLASMRAIRQARTVTVTFNPGTTQYALAWTNPGGGVSTRMAYLGTQGETFVFDANPPGNPPAPDAAFIFSPLGFISTTNGNVAGNIYLTNSDNSRRFQIQTTIAGGIDLNRYDPAAGWTNAY